MKLPKFTEEQITQMAKDFEKDQNRALDILKVFYLSPRFEQVFSQTKNAAYQYSSVGDNAYQEPLFGDVTNEEFIMMFSCLFEESISGLKFEETGESGFWEERVIYSGLEFIQIYGQGTAFIVKRLQ